MPTRPSIRSNFLPTCTCRPSLPSTSKPLPPRKNLATLSLPNSTPSEPYLDFLYPTFGFFSRALPPIPVVLLPSSFNLFPRFSSSGIKVGVRSSWKRTVSLERKCVCGRAQHSCLRCRAASTSARVGVKEIVMDEESEELSSAEVILLEGDRSVDSPKPLPPPPLGVDQQIIENKKLIIRIENLYRRIDKELPSVRGHANVRTLWSLERTKKTSNELLEVLEPLKETKGAGLASTLQLDLIRVFARLARMLPIKGKAQDLVEDYRQELGEYMEDFLNTFSAGQGNKHAISLALLRINSAALNNMLPSIVSPSRASDEDLFYIDLRTIFQPTNFDTASADQKKRIIQAQRSAFSVLLDIWSRSENGPTEAVKFVAGWELTSLFSESSREKNLSSDYGILLRQRYISLISRIQPTPYIWFRDYYDSPEAEKRIGPHLITYLSDRTSVLEALEIWKLLKSKSAIIYIFTSLNTPAVIDGLLDSGYLLDAADVAKYLADDLLGYFSRNNEDLDFTTTTTDSDSINTATISPIPVIPDHIMKEYNSTFVEAYRILAKVTAAEGRPEKTFEIISTLESIGWETGLEGVARQMRANAEAQELERVKAHFKSASFEGTTAFNRSRLWGELVRAQVRLGDLEGGLNSLDEMVKSKLSPNRPLVTSLLYGYVNQGDLAGAYFLFNKLPQFKIFPNVVTYTALATLQSRRRNPEGVQQIIQEMREEGLEPDLTTWTAFMDCLVEVGSYPAALNIFEYLHKNKDPSLHPDTPARNIVLKAGCLAGAPPLTSLALIRDGIERGIRPNYQTYTLLMHTLCSAGMMNHAEDLYVLMGDTERNNALPTSMDIIKPDVFIYSTMIYGYLNRAKLRYDEGRSNEAIKLHADDVVRARATLFEMVKRGITPTQVTTGIIVGAFLEEGRKDSLEKAEIAAKEFLKGYNLRAPVIRKRNTPLARRDVYSVFGPIINAHAKNMSPEKALSYFTTILAANSEPSILQHTSLMDAFRRTGQTNSVRTVWRRLYNTIISRHGRAIEIEIEQPVEKEVDTTLLSGDKSSSSIKAIATSSPIQSDQVDTSHETPPHLTLDTSPPPISSEIPLLSSLPLTSIKIDPYHRNILTLPLTVLIDSLSSDESFREIIQTWQQLSNEGFTFDASNWNSLALALCRRGEFQRAFDIAENILCASQEGIIDASTAVIEFGQPDRVENVLRNPARLAQFRRKDGQNVNSILTGSLRDLIGYENREVSKGKGEKDWKHSEVSGVLVDISKKRRNQYWYIHTSLVLALDKILRLLSSRGSSRILGEELADYQNRIEEEKLLREKLVRNHPKTIRRVRVRMNDLERMEDARRDRL